MRFFSIFLAVFLWLFSMSPLVEAASMPTLTITSSGLAVVTLQQDLIKLGYLYGNADGAFGPYTKAALVAFQKAHGLYQDGVAGPATWAALTQTTSPIPAPVYHTLAATTFPTLLQGSSGPSVVTIQGDLMQLGYFSGIATGTFGPYTRNSVVSFQKAAGLISDGIVGPATWAALAKGVATPPTPALAPPPILISSRGPTTSPSSQPLQVQGYYVQYGSGSYDSWGSLQANASQLTSIAPLWVAVNSNGSLHPTGTNWSTITSFAQSHGLKVLVMVTNNNGSGTVLLDPTAEETAVANIKNLVTTNGFNGINIDFEGLPMGDRNALSTFVSDLANALHPLGDLVTVDVGARTSDNSTLNPDGAVYDYAALGQVADQIDIMAYDYSGPWSTAGPVSPLPWVTDCVRYALNYIPPNKIMLGIAAYGYDWTWSGATSLTSAQALALAAQTGATIHTDPASSERWFAYYDSYGAHHTVWFEDSVSLTSKLALVKNTGIAGIALWRLNGEDSGFWPTISAAN